MRGSRTALNAAMILEMMCCQDDFMIFNEMNRSHWMSTYGRIELLEGDPDFMYLITPENQEGIRITHE